MRLQVRERVLARPGAGGAKPKHRPGRQLRARLPTRFGEAAAGLLAALDVRDGGRLRERDQAHTTSARKRRA